ncbi:MAG: HWE histidine kinase domain-containing protein, partial [Cyanobacteria bacterium J06642_2]
LVRSLSQQTLEHNGSIESYVSALDARIASVSAAHDLGAEKSSYNATVQQIIGIEANPYNHNSQLIKVSGDD